jgi:endoglucanase
MRSGRILGPYNSIIIPLVSPNSPSFPLIYQLTCTTKDDFIFSAWGKTTFGSAADIATLTQDLSLIRSNFTDVPLLIGEWAASPVATETAARWRYFDAFLRAAASFNISTVLWDNGADFLNRATHTWRDEVALDIYRNVVKGEKNALPESTTDGSATSQSSSAYIYHKAGTNVSDVTLPFNFAGNTLLSAKDSKTGKTLKKDTDYTLTTGTGSPDTLTIKQTFLSTILTPSTTTTGSLSNITLTFSHGTHLLVNVLSWRVPTVPTTTFKLPAPSSDLLIPVQWAGQNRVATVKAVKSGGGYLVDDWTQWLGPLQQGRMTYSGQWDWVAEGVVIKSAALEEVRKLGAGASVVFTVEFYPRVEGNSVNVTVSV